MLTLQPYPHRTSRPTGLIRLLIATCLLWVIGVGSSALAGTPLESVSISPDTAIEIDAALFPDESVAVDDLAGGAMQASLGSIPRNASVMAYHRLSNGDQLISFDTSLVLAGSLTVARGDVVRFDGVSYTIEFDASGNGIPSGSFVDAISMINAQDLLLSFDTAVEFPLFVAGDEDLVRCNLPAAGVCATFGTDPFFDGSDLPGDDVPSDLDLDGAHLIEANGNLLVSFGGSGLLGGVDFQDEDVLEFGPATGTWEKVYDGSAQDAAWVAADVEAVAVPEPQASWGLIAGASLMALMGRSRTV